MTSHAVLRISALGMLLLALGCGKRERSRAAEPMKAEIAPAEEAKKLSRGHEGMAGARRALKEKAFDAPAAAAPKPMAKDMVGGGGGAAGPQGYAAAMMDEDVANAKGGEGQAEGPAAKPRAWFPETFLFEPLVLTDDNGSAKVHVRVPDRLTTWRILALAHSREGGQAGTETSFLGTLPIYVDPVLPPFLSSGDEVGLPVQVVNTTDKTLERTLAIDAAGSAEVHKTAKVKVPPSSSTVELTTIRATRPGKVSFKAALGDKDAVEKSFTVFPTGKPIAGNKGGTLAAPRKIAVEIPRDAEKDASSVRLLVFPGALALLRSELRAASFRGGVAADAYSLLLAGRGDALVRSLGGDTDPKAQRNLSIIAGQRVIRDARSPDVGAASLLAEAALANPENPVIARLGERLADTVARNQRPDGTFQGAESGWTLQRLMVASADSVRAVLAAAETQPQKQRGERARLLAEGAFERNVELVTDAYTASAIVASGSVKGSLAERFRQKIRDKVKRSPDGAAALEMEKDTVRADGSEATQIQGTALAILALDGDEKSKALLPDLGATLLASYNPQTGWGDGETNLAALRAVLALFKDPLPATVKVSLALDDKVLAEGVLEGAKLKEVLPLDADLPNVTGAHTFHVTADPPVPGLGFSLTWKIYEPWKAVEEPKGMEIAIEQPKKLRVGKAAEIGVSAAAPAGLPLEIRVALPAAVEPDRPSLDQLVAQGTALSYRTEDGAVTFQVASLGPGQSFQARFRAIATLSGKLFAGPSTIRATNGGETFFAPPSKWEIAER